MKLLNLSLTLLAACLTLAVAPVYSQTNGGVKTKRATNITERTQLKLSGEEYLTPNLDEIQNVPIRSTRPGVPPPKLPLYRQYPTDQVVVGEVGDLVLLRSELEKMATARLMLLKLK